MIFKTTDLEGIRNGNITLAFRKWKKASVKKGTLMNTAIGQIEILDVLITDISEIDETQAKLAGFSHLHQLSEFLSKRDSGDVYKIMVRYHSPDPRIALRNDQNLTDQEFDKIQNRLLRFDAFSKQGPWTILFLELIESNPHVRAKDLALKIGKEKDWLKINVRKLKNLGLTISHGVGYSISPRGNTYLARLRSQ